MPLRPARRRGGIPVVGAELTAGRLLELPVRLNGIQLGLPVDLVLDLDSRRVIGLDVLCGDETRRYLPLAAAHVSGDEIAIRSPLVLFDERDLAWYRRRATPLDEVRGTPVRRGRRELGALSDVLLAADGSLAALVVEEDGQTRRVPVDDAVTIAGRGSASAA